MKRCCVYSGKTETCSRFGNWRGRCIQCVSTYASVSVLYSRKKNVLLLSCSTLYWLSYPQIAFKGETLWCLPLRPEVSTAFFFNSGKGRRNQAEKTLPRYKCVEERRTRAQQYSGAAAAVLRTFLTKSSHWVGRTSSAASGIPAPQSPSPLLSVMLPCAEATLDFTHCSNKSLQLSRVLPNRQIKCLHHPREPWS